MAHNMVRTVLYDSSGKESSHQEMQPEHAISKLIAQLDTISWSEENLGYKLHIDANAVSLRIFPPGATQSKPLFVIHPLYDAAEAWVEVTNFAYALQHMWHYGLVVTRYTLQTK